MDQPTTAPAAEPARLKSHCTAPDCARRVNARGLCGLHYRRAQNAGLFGTPCCEKECDKPVVARGLCGTHYARIYAASNRESVNAYQREYMKGYRARGMPESVVQSMRAAGERYRQRNMDKFAAKERLRRDRKRANGGSHTDKDWLCLLNRYRGKCAYCEKRPAIATDHVVPISRGGTDFIGNILPVCQRCNNSKSNLLLIEWRARRARRNNSRG